MKFILLIVCVLINSSCNPLGGTSEADPNYNPGIQAQEPEVFPVPIVSSITPTAGYFSGGLVLTISGTTFRPGVSFEINNVPCSSSQFINSTTGTCTTPAHSSIGKYSIKAKNSDGKIGELQNAFHYIGEPQMWLRADSILGLSSGDNISLWEDQSSKQNDFEQTNPSLQPTWISNSLNAKPVIHFNGDSLTSLQNFDLSMAAPRTAIFVIKQASVGNSNFFGWGTNATNSIFDMMIYNGRSMVHFYVNDSYGASSAFTAGAWTVITSIYNGSEVKDYVNGVGTNVGSSLSLTTSNTKATIGMGIFGSYNNFTGDMAEAIILPIAANPSEKNLIECYLAQKYGLSLSTCP